MASAASNRSIHLPQPTRQQAAIYQLCLKQASEGGRALMSGLLTEIRQALLARSPSTRPGSGGGQSLDLLVRHAQELCDQYPVELLRAFSEAANPPPGKALPVGDLRFDQLELMDDNEVQEKLELARAQQSALDEVEGPLEELTALISTAQGFKTVQPERNPFKPASYVTALNRVCVQTGVSVDVRVVWLQICASALGKRLWDTYTSLCALLKSAEIARAPYQITPGYAGGVDPGEGAELGDFALSESYSVGDVLKLPPKTAPAAPQAASSTEPGMVPGAGPGDLPGAAPGAVAGTPNEWNSTHLTVKQLRRLLAGEFDPIRETGAPARRSSRATAAPTSDIDSRSSDFGNSGFEFTVPAALEALEEMKQVEKAMSRLAGRRPPMRKRVAQVSPSSTPLDSTAFRPMEAADDSARHVHSATELAGLGRHELYEVLRSQAHNIGQVLGLEVVSLMVENIAKDPSLLPAVQVVIQSLESPLLQLAMVDPRFFNDRQHPARRLLEGIVAQARRFESETSPAFAAFIYRLRVVVNDLQPVPIEGPEPFSLCLETLRQVWDEEQKKDRKQREQAENTLREAEQRNLLATQIAATIRSHSDVSAVPEAVLAFVTGPWAQVIAKARLDTVSSGAAPGGVASAAAEADRYMALVADLFWSVSTAQAKTDPSRLIKLIPGLLSRLRNGLKLIQYPQADINAFFEVLIALHQKALIPKSATATGAADTSLGAPTSKAHQPDLMARQTTRSQSQENPVWLAPNEALASGFLDDLEFPNDLETRHSTAVPDAADSTLGDEDGPLSMSQIMADSSIPLGTWLDITTDAHQMRAELVWASPERTMYMFTTTTGRNVSMTRSSLDRLIQKGRVSVVPPSNVLGSALDAVAQTALRNSVDKP